MLLNNRYRILRTLGSGGFGETSLAEDTQMPSLRRCVIKQLKPIHDNPQIYQLVQERFHREAAILEELGGNSDQIPTLYAYFQLDDRFYLVQEYVEGDTLTAKLRQHGILSENTVAGILASLLPVLEYVHSKKIVHRDIKPDNIILRHRDGKPVLIDFGAVRETMGTALNSQGNPTSSIIIGTPGYMPSEQAMGRPIYASDLYSLGLTAIYLLTGKSPQELETHPSTGELVWQSHVINVSATTAALLNRAIAYHPRDRFSSAREMLQALQTGSLSILPTTPLTQPPSFTPPLPTKSQETLLFNSGVSSRETSLYNNRQRGGLALSIIAAAAVIGASVIIGLALTRTPPSVEQPSTSLGTPSQATPNISLSPKSQVTDNASSGSTSSPQKTPIPTKQNANKANFPHAFYFLADSAYPNSQTALMQVKALQAVGYSQAGMFRIPEYPNLSGKELFEVYVAQFSDRNNCIDLLRTYGQANSNAYCAFASKDPNAPPERLYFQEISTSSSDTFRDTNTTKNDYFWLSEREVTDTDLDGKDGFELDIMRNTIFARHGRRFQTAGLQKYFDGKPWYRPKYSPDNFPNELLSNVERWNVDYINKYQDRYNRRYFR
ncbi:MULTISPECIES: protein kinase domain-containing protein [Nostocales]|uniref:non-specific serine/threonine protein kinase n=3 Tax=Nostocales TaxID=1161 RepID=A0A0C1N4E2_9CYAN|nr:YARHG domain-containing protein [Tolypothrix bouteillei]KAF3884012.1 YARHG domain-containing protein [Tolypothrix bouteillei VB521301]